MFDLPGTSVCPAIALSGPLTGGTFGVPYAGAVTASGGTPPYLFGVTGTLPSGLVLASGGAIGGSQLNATAAVAGAFDYTPVAGTVLEAGDGRPLHVAFLPADA